MKITMDDTVTLDSLTRRYRQSAYARARDKFVAGELAWQFRNWEKVWEDAMWKLFEDDQFQQDWADYERETKALQCRSRRNESKMADDGL